MVAIGEPARIIYTNYRGETAERIITPKRVWYGISDWHPVPQWFLTAFDHDKNADRDFALRDFGHTKPSTAREMALEEAANRFDRIADIINRNLYHQQEKIKDAQYIAAEGSAAIRTLFSPDHADADKCDAFDLIERVEALIRRNTRLDHGKATDQVAMEIIALVQSKLDHADAGKVEGDGLQSSAISNLIEAAKEEAAKAMRKFPQPNYVISKIAEEAGEVVKAAIHCAEGRENPEAVIAEITQTFAMLFRLLLEGDEVHGLSPLLPSAPSREVVGS